MIQEQIEEKKWPASAAARRRGNGRRVVSRTASREPEAVRGLQTVRAAQAAFPLTLAGRFSSKVLGLLASPPSENALLLMPCCDVHTAGMRHRLDVAFVDAAGLVMEAHRDVGPFRRLRKRGAVAVVERFASCSSPWFSEGDRIGVVCVERGKL